jgi:hypothetical protein
MHLTADQVTHASMNELSGTARGCLREITRFYESSAESSSRSVHRDSKSRGSAADYQHIKLALERAKFLGAVCHRRKLLLQEDTTSCR